MQNNKPSITFFGGVGQVTGANFLLEYKNFKALIDCGLLQGTNDSENQNKKPFPYNPAEISYLFLTHAHMDHIGKVPKLVRDGFKGKIFSTETTKQIAKHLLHDAVKISFFESRETNKEPIYNEEDVKETFTLWETISYNSPKKITEDVYVTLKNAGHILGSAMFTFNLSSEDDKEIKVLFTGDLGNSPDILLPDTDKVEGLDYLVMDSVYGDRNHESPEIKSKKFADIIEETIRKKKTLLIPAFSLERTQVILYELNELIENKIVPQVPVFLDSPLAIKITEIFESVDSFYKDEVREDIRRGDKIFDFPRLKKTARVSDSKKISKVPGPKIIIAGSGMSVGGRILRHEKIYLPKKDTTILFVGYQSPGTLGREILEGAKSVNIDGKTIPVHAKVEFISGYSSHKDMDNLIEFVDNTKDSLKEVFVVMGEPKSSFFLSQRIRDFLGVKTTVPEPSKKYYLNF